MISIPAVSRKTALRVWVGGTLTLAGANTFSGDTRIDEDEDENLVLSNQNALQNSTVLNMPSFGGGLTSATFGGISGSEGLALPSGFTLTVGGNNASTTYSGVLSGPGSFVKTGSGQLTLSGANTFSGASTITAGTLALTNSNALQNSTVIYDYGTLDLSGLSAVALGGLEGSRNLTLPSNTLTVGGNNSSTTYSGVLSGTGSLTKTGTGTLKLSGSNANTYQGGTTISAGMIEAITPEKLPGYSQSGNLSVLTGATMAIYVTNNNENTNWESGDLGYLLANPTFTMGNIGIEVAPGKTFTYESAINRDRGLVKLGTGTLKLSGSTPNEYTGGTTIFEGMLEALTPEKLPGYSQSGKLNVSDDATVAVYTTDGTNETYWKSDEINSLIGNPSFTHGNLGIDVASGSEYFNYQAISGTRGLVKLGPGSLVLIGDNNYEGITAIQEGDLFPGYLYDSGTIGTGDVEIAANARLMCVYTLADTTLANNISGDGTITNSVTLTLTGNIDVENIVTDGTLYLGDGGSSGSIGSQSISGGYPGTLVFNYGHDLSFNNVISGSLDVIQQGSGTLTLGGENTYTGTTSITNGTVVANKIVVSDGNSNLGNATSSVILGDGSNSGVLSYTGNTATFTRGFAIYSGNGEVDTVVSGQTLTYAITSSDGILTVGGEGDTVITNTGYITSLSKTDSGTLTVTDNCNFDNGIVEAGLLNVTGSVSFYNLTVNGGTLQVSGTLGLLFPLNNHATFILNESGEVDLGGVKNIYGKSTPISGTEEYVTWVGFEYSSGTTYNYEISANGNDYFPFASGLANDTAAMFSGLQRDTNYYLKVEANHLDGSKEIFKSGIVKTLDKPDTSGFYRVGPITSDTGDFTIPPGEALPSSPSSTAYATSAIVPQNTVDALGIPGAWGYSFGATTSQQNGVFKQDTSWIYAGSMQGAILQSILGLVRDGSIPTIDQSSGVIKIYHIEDVLDGQLVLDAGYSFDRKDYPTGGYSQLTRCAFPYTPGFGGGFFNPFFPSDPNYPGCPGSPGGSGCTPCGDASANPAGGSNGNCGAPSEKSNASMIAMNAVDNTGGSAACNLGRGGLTYDSRESAFDCGYGPGWNDTDELASMFVSRNTLAVQFGAESSVWFDTQSDGSFVARYGSKQTLVHDSQYHLFVLTQQDGTRYEFYDSDQIDPITGGILPLGSLKRSVAPSGATVEVVGWTDASAGDNKIEKWVQYKTNPLGNAYQEREFVYWNGGADAGHIDSIVLWEYDTGIADFIPVRQISYDYYGTGESYGLPGDLKTIVTKQWDPGAGDWIGNDTNYFRYYSDDAGGTGFAHGLKRVVLANAYKSLSDYATQQSTTVENLSETVLDSYTCFYYKYDSNHRVTDRVVFGLTNESTFENHLSDFGKNYNNWYRRSKETRLDGSTNTIYTNYIGETLLTDLCDSSGNHWVTYNRYDETGRLVLTAQPSAFVAQSGNFYDENLPDLINFATDSPYLSNTEGLFKITTYYENDGGGQAKGYVYQEAGARGETSARLIPGSIGGPIVQTSYEYASRTVDGETIHPISSKTTYSKEDGTGAATTTYAYTWYDGVFQIQEKIITLPTVSFDQNGSGQNGITARQWFDDHGKLTWSMDELHRVTYTQYDLLTGHLETKIDDIDADYASSLSLTPPTGWPIPASGGTNQQTDYQYDAFDRVTQTLGPVHNVILSTGPTNVRTATWTFYNDAAHETRFAQGYAKESAPNHWDDFTIVGPVSILKTDLDGRQTHKIQAEYNGMVADLATATMSQSDYTAWMAYKYGNTRLVNMVVYDDIPCGFSDPDEDGFIGTSGVNYEKTTYAYENYGSSKKGRQIKTVTPDGTITRNVLDARGKVVETWIGTDDTGATDRSPGNGGVGGNNMVKISGSTYDINGNLEKSLSYFDSGENDYYAMDYQYDWRNRRTGMLTQANFVVHYEYDNLGRVEWTKTYASDDFDLNDNELRAQTEKLYDDLGRVYESRVYEVDQATSADPGHVRDYLTTKTWYDACGQVVKTVNSNGLFQKHAYDGMGRQVMSYTSFDVDESTTGSDLEKYNEALDVSGDKVIEQKQFWYDGAGKAIASANYQRLPDDNGTGGPLSAANSYTTAQANWYDGLGRIVATADFGREDRLADSSWTSYFFHKTNGTDAGGVYAAGDLIDIDRNGIPDVAELSRTANNIETLVEDATSPAGIDFRLQLTEYNSAGRAYRTKDNLGRINETEYDATGRAVRTIQNYDDGMVQDDDREKDITVDYGYDASGRLATMTAYNAKGSGNGFETQMTAYLYTSPINASWRTNAIYPDSVDGKDVASVSRSGGTAIAMVSNHGFTTGQWVYILGADQAQFNGRVQITVVNANTFTYSIPMSAPISTAGTIRVYDANGNDQVKTTYDRLGRTASATDQRGVKHNYTFDSAGRLSADTADLANVLPGQNVDNSILCIGTTYDDMGRVEKVTSYSDILGTTAVNEVKSVYNGWGKLYQEFQEHRGTVDANTLYVQYNYEDGAAGGVAKYVRLAETVYPNGRTVDYGYGTTDAVDDIMSRLETVGDSSGTIASYKYLGAKKIVTEDYEAAEVRLDYTHDDLDGFDRFGRVADQLWERYGNDPAVLDEYTYTYDRTGNVESKTNVLHNAFSETYEYNALDALTSAVRNDNFDQSWTLDGLGNWSEFNDGGFIQTRTVDQANQITAIAGGWATPTYDRAGNMITVPKPSDSTQSLGLKYDAWNHLVEVTDGSILLAKFHYDSNGRRIEQLTDFVEGVPQTVTHYYLSTDNQVLETREGSPTTVPESLNTKYQYIWSPRYIDSLILRDEYSGGVIQPASRLFYLSDANYNVTSVVKQVVDKWEVVERYVYDSYGKATIYTPNWLPSQTTSLFNNTNLFTGRELDIATELMYFRARYYNTRLGTFVNRDPLVYKGGDTNLYRYVGDSPLNRTDPMGHWWWDDDWIQYGIGGLLGAHGSEVAGAGWSNFGGGCATVSAMMNSPWTNCICELAALGDTLMDIVLLVAPNPGALIANFSISLIDCGCNMLGSLDQFCRRGCCTGLKDSVLTGVDCLVDLSPAVAAITDVIWAFLQEHNRNENIVNRVRRLNSCFEIVGIQRFLI